MPPDTWRRAILALMVVLSTPAVAGKTSLILPETPEPTRFVVRGPAIVDRQQGDAPVFFRGIGYSPYLRGASPLLGMDLPDDGRYAANLDLARQLGANYLHVFPNPMPPAFFAALDAADLVYGQDIWIQPRAPDFLADDFQSGTSARLRTIIDHAYRVGRPDRLVLFSVGDELAPESIAATDRLHPDVHDFQGRHLAVSGRTPTEVALARLIDGAMDYELTRYGRRHLYCHTSFTHVGPLPRPDLEVPPESAVLPDLGDLVCLNVYTYARGVISSPPGSVTGTSYQGYLEELTAATAKPVFITQVGLSTSPFEPKPWVPGFGGHRVEDVPATFRAVWQDVRTARGKEHITGLAFFELHDEWWKSGETADDSTRLNPEDPEEWFGLYALDDAGHLIPKGAIPETVRAIFGRPRALSDPSSRVLEGEQPR
mgnify:CR=1 FL=1